MSAACSASEVLTRFLQQRSTLGITQLTYRIRSRQISSAFTKAYFSAASATSRMIENGGKCCPSVFPTSPVAHLSKMSKISDLSDSSMGVSGASKPPEGKTSEAADRICRFKPNVKPSEERNDTSPCRRTLAYYRTSDKGCKFEAVKPHAVNRAEFVGY